MGAIIGLFIMAIWGGHLYYMLTYVTLDPASPWLYVHILIQTYLSTGLFITCHDAMHRTVSPVKWLNNSIGFTSLLLYAGMWYPRMLKNHHLHHKNPGSESDPDFHTGSQNFWVWWFTFMVRYLTIAQLVFMAVAYNVLKIWYDDARLWLLWILPSILSTLQLFYFGTYLPHRRPHEEEMQPHRARSQKKNHLWAMVSCYFFGYHYEHHESPWTPWWQLYKTKETLNDQTQV
jgi:beta-carotene ketolase (CrtW type)